MAHFSPSKFKLSDPELKAVENAAQLASYHCIDPALSGTEIQKSVNEAFKLCFEALEKKGRQKKASEQQARVLQAEVGRMKMKIQQLTNKVECLEVASAFYADEKVDASSQTGEGPELEMEEEVNITTEN